MLNTNDMTEGELRAYEAGLRFNGDRWVEMLSVDKRLKDKEALDKTLMERFRYEGIQQAAPDNGPYGSPYAGPLRVTANHFFPWSR